MTSIYLVVVAHLNPTQLVLIGSGQALVVRLAEVPAGVFADVISRRHSIGLGHLVSGAGMVMAGVTTRFSQLLISQVLWGLGWAFIDGADVAWITDELDELSRIDHTLASGARWGSIGAVTGLATFGGLATIVGLRNAIVASGVAFAALGVGVHRRFVEHHFRPAVTAERWGKARSIMAGGLRLARHDREILLVALGWLLVNGAGQGYGRLTQKRLIALGFGGTRLVLWFAGLGLLTGLLNATVLRAIEAHIHRAGVVRRVWIICCVVGALGLLLFAYAPSAPYAVGAALLCSGAVGPGVVLRAITQIWVNRRTPSAGARDGSFAPLPGRTVRGIGPWPCIGWHHRHQHEMSVALAGSAALLGIAATVVRKVAQSSTAARR